MFDVGNLGGRLKEAKERQKRIVLQELRKIWQQDLGTKTNRFIQCHRTLEILVKNIDMIGDDLSNQACE